jgi:hypothetical protein
VVLAFVLLALPIPHMVGGFGRAMSGARLRDTSG